MENAQLIDISHWDGGPDDNLQVMDFARYAEAYPGVIIKISEGTVADPLFRRQWEAARGHVRRHPYHFFRSYVNQKLAVQKMMELLGNDQGEAEAVLDAEAADGSTQVMSLMHVWTDEYHRLSGKWPMVYSNIPFLTKHGAFAKTIWGAFKNPWLANCRLWLAQYPFDMIESMTGYSEVGDLLRTILIREVMEGARTLTWPKVAPPFKGVYLWQWTSRLPPESIPGYYLGANHKLAVDHNFHILTDAAYREIYPIQAPPQPGEPTMYLGTVLASPGMNIRSSPAVLATNDIGDVKYNDKLEADRIENDWWHIVKINGVARTQDTWAFAKAGAYIRLDGQTAPPPPSTGHTMSVDLVVKWDGVVIDEFHREYTQPA